MSDDREANMGRRFLSTELSVAAVRRGSASVVAMILLLAASLAPAQPRLPNDPQALFQLWINGTCLGDEAAALRSAVRANAGVLADAFRRALVEGPPESQIAAVRSNAERSYAQRAKFALQTFRVAGATTDALARFRAVTAQQFTDDEVRRFTLGYRANAVAALGLLDDAPSRELLARMAANPNDPLAAAARAALQAR